MAFNIGNQLGKGNIGNNYGHANKGRKLPSPSKEIRKKLSLALKGFKRSPETRLKMSLCRQKEKHWNWKGGTTRNVQLEKLAGRKKPMQCEICGETGQICFDHDHLTNKFRGWICFKCNFALGYAKDNPYLLQKLSEYLIKHLNQPT